jgi:uncharacterized membrane protein
MRQYLHTILALAVSTLAAEAFAGELDGRPMVDLGTFDGPGYNFSDAGGVNSSGVVVGESAVVVDGGPPTKQRAMRWTRTADGAVQKEALAHTLHNPEVAGQTIVTSRAVGINEAGIIVAQIIVNPGILPNGTFGVTSRGAVYENGGFRIVTVNHGAAARGINDKGQVTGTGFPGRAYVFTPGVSGLRLLDPLPGQGVSNGFAINDSGDVVGSSGPYPVLWRAPDYVPVALDNDVPDGPSMDGRLLSFGRHINDAGLICGIDQIHMGLWHATAPEWSLLPERLGALNGLNSHGDAVGYRGQNAGGGVEREAVLWRAGADRYIELGTLGGKTSFGRAVSDRGDIVGLSDIESGETHAFAIFAD